MPGLINPQPGIMNATLSIMMQLMRSPRLFPPGSKRKGKKRGEKKRGEKKERKKGREKRVIKE